MVVRDDQIYAQFPGKGSLFHGGDAVIHRDHKGVAFGGQFFQCVPGDTIAAAIPAGQLAAHLRTQAGQALIKNGRGGNAVHIIVAKNNDGLPVFHRRLDAFHGPFHILEQKGVREGRLLLQPLRRRPGRRDAPGSQNPGQQRAIPRRREGLLPRSIGGFQLPGTVIHRLVLPFCPAEPKSLSKLWVRPSWLSMASSVSISVETSMLTSWSSVS